MAGSPAARPCAVVPGSVGAGEEPPPPPPLPCGAAVAPREAAAGFSRRMSMRVSARISGRVSGQQTTECGAGAASRQSSISSFDSYETASADAWVATGTVFLDAEAIKRKIQATVGKKACSLASYYKEEGVCQAVAKNQRLAHFMLAVVALNSVWIAVEADHASALESDRGGHLAALVVRHLFSVIFAGELLVRFGALRRKRDAMNDGGWFILDALLVLGDVVELLVFGVLSPAWGAGNASLLRLARLLQLFKMVRVIRLFRAVPELMILVQGMVAALRSVLFTFIFLVFVLYVFGVAMKYLTLGTEVGVSHFATVLDSMFTLFIHGALLDDLSQLARALRAEAAMATVTFVMFIVITALTVMNMLVGVLCEVFRAVSTVETEGLVASALRERFTDILRRIDANGDAYVSRAEFASILDDAHSIKHLQAAGIDAAGLVDFADILFEGEDGTLCETVSFPKFIDHLLDMRGSRAPAMKDMVNMRKYIRQTTQHIMSQVEETNARLARLEKGSVGRFCGKGRIAKRRTASLVHTTGSGSALSIHPSRAADREQLREKTPSKGLEEPLAMPLPEWDWDFELVDRLEEMLQIVQQLTLSKGHPGAAPDRTALDPDPLRGSPPPSPPQKRRSAHAATGDAADVAGGGGVVGRRSWHPGPPLCPGPHEAEELERPAAARCGGGRAACGGGGVWWCAVEAEEDPVECRRPGTPARDAWADQRISAPATP